MNQQPDLFSVPILPVDPPAPPRVRKNRAERVIEFITSRPYVWIHAVEFEPIGGRQAWRTAIAEARLQLEASHRGTIENRVYKRRGSGEKVSEYRYIR